VKKVSIIGAGNVGSALAERVLTHNLADVALVDVLGDMAKAKAYDLMDAAPIMGYEKEIQGSSDYAIIKDSNIVVITAGLARKPGMTREDLIAKNGGIVKSVLKEVVKFTQNAIIMIVTNPLDVMTYLAHKELKCSRNKIIGMAGNLDTARFKTLLSEELNVPAKNIDTMVLGSHGDTMVSLVSKTTVNGKPLEKVLKGDKLNSLLERTKKRGGEIVGLLKSGSAYFSPSAACFEILEVLIGGREKVIACSCILEGEYGIKDCAIGVPALINATGIKEIVELKLTSEELSALNDSAKAVQDTLKKL